MKIILAIASAGLILLGSRTGQAQGVYHNQRICVVPAPGKVVIDADLKDWDLSGEIYTYVIEAASEFQSARTAMMYDAEALYICSRVADPSPLLNKADPAVNPDFGWDGDAFQFRLCLDPGLGYPLKIGGYDRNPSEMLVHMTLWYHRESKTPVLHLKYGMNYHDALGYRLGCRWYDMYEFPIPKPGELYGCTRNLGITDGITSFSCYFGQAQLITTDGVVIGTIMKDGRSGETGPDQIQCEWFTGQLVKLKDGRWFLLGGDQDGRVLEVTGLNTIRRFEGRLTIAPDDARAAAAALAEWTAQRAKGQPLVLSRCPGKPDWINLRAIKIDIDQRRGFAVKAAYNAADLVLRYEVRSPFELVNSTPEQNMLFKGGNLTVARGFACWAWAFSGTMSARHTNAIARNRFSLSCKITSPWSLRIGLLIVSTRISSPSSPRNDSSCCMEWRDRMTARSKSHAFVRRRLAGTRNRSSPGRSWRPHRGGGNMPD